MAIKSLSFCFRLLFLLVFSPFAKGALLGGAKQLNKGSNALEQRKRRRGTRENGKANMKKGALKWQHLSVTDSAVKSRHRQVRTAKKYPVNAQFINLI